MCHLVKALYFFLVKIVDTIYEILKHAKDRAVDVCHDTSPSFPIILRVSAKKKKRPSLVRWLHHFVPCEIESCRLTRKSSPAPEYRLEKGLGRYLYLTRQRITTTIPDPS